MSAFIVQSALLPRRACLKYSIDLNNASKSYADEGSTEIAMCNKWENMCYILWKKDIKGRKIFVTVLRRGCWHYENNEKESCNTCLSSQHSFGNNMYFCCCREDLCNDRFRTKNVLQTTIISTSSQSTGIFLVLCMLAGSSCKDTASGPSTACSYSKRMQGVFSTCLMGMAAKW